LKEVTEKIIKTKEILANSKDKKKELDNQDSQQSYLKKNCFFKIPVILV
jgi:hypothetical protein